MNKSIIAFSLLAIILIIFAYSNHFNNSFHFDDSHTIENNASIRNMNNAALFFVNAETFSANPMNQSYRPLITLSFAIDYYIAGGLNPTVFHLHSFVVFLLQLVFMFLIFKKILKDSLDCDYTDYISLFAVTWYGLHTVNAETLNYISARSDLYSTFFVVASMFVYIYFPKKRKYFLYLIPLIPGVLSKEQAIMFAPILFMYILLFENRNPISELFAKRNRKELGQIFLKSLAAIVVCGLGSIIVMKMQPETFNPGGTSVVSYLITQPWVILRYFILFFVPVQLSADTDWVAIGNVFDERVLVGFAFVVSMVFLMIKLSNKREWRPVSWGIAWFFLALLPTSSFIPLAEVTNDHRMFFPFVGLSISVMSAIAIALKRYNISNNKFRFRKPAIIVAAIIILTGNLYGVRIRNEVWRTEESLWYDVTIKSPNNARGLMNYGLAQMRKQNYDTALIYYNKALLISPYYPYLHINMGVLYNSTGNTESAEHSFIQALNYGDNLYLSHYNYAAFLYAQKRISEAKPYAEKALELSPGYLANRNLLADIYLDLNETIALKNIISETLNMYPGDPHSTALSKIDFNGKPLRLQLAEQTAIDNPTASNYLNLSLEYYNQQMYNECIDACYSALAIDPKYALAYNNICSAYNALGEFDKAIEACEKAIELDPEYTLAKNNLNLALKNRNQ